MRRKTWKSVPRLIVFLLFCGTAFAQYSEAQYDNEEAQLYWDELGPLIFRETIEMTLPDGTRLKGITRGITDQSLELIVAETTDPMNHPKGFRTIPRDSVTRIVLHTVRPSSNSGEGGRMLGGLAGVLAGQYLALMAGLKIDERLTLPVLLGTVAGGAILGRRLSTRPEKTTTRIQILPDPAPNPPGLDSPGDLLASQQHSASRAKGIAAVSRQGSSAGSSPSLSGKRLIRRQPRKPPAPDYWPVIPNQSRVNWAF